MIYLKANVEHIEFCNWLLFDWGLKIKLDPLLGGLQMEEYNDLIILTSEIVSSYVANNAIQSDGITRAADVLFKLALEAAVAAG
jgi:hypothetical protein